MANIPQGEGGEYGEGGEFGKGGEERERQIISLQWRITFQDVLNHSQSDACNVETKNTKVSVENIHPWILDPYHLLITKCHKKINIGCKEPCVLIF